MISENMRPPTEEEIELAEREAAEEQRAREDMLTSLAIAITGKFDMRSGKRQVKESEWLESQRLYMGKLSSMNENSNSGEPFRIKSKRTRPDVNIVRAKTDIAIAQAVSQQFGTTEKNWGLLPPADNHDAAVAEACRRMEGTITQQLDHCGYAKKARRALEYRSIIGTGVLKGPLNTGKMKKTYRQIQGSDMWEPIVEQDMYPSVECVNPWFFYPDDTTNDPTDLNDALEVHPMSAFDLKKYVNHPGFIADEIISVLKEKPAEYNATNYSEYATLTDSNPYLFKDKYIVLEYHGPITRTQLDKLDIEPTYDALDDEYYGEVWVCQGKVIRIELENIEACFRIPYYMSVWKEDPASVFGFGVPIMMRDAQRVVNETWHMILDNSSISSGPQAAIQKNFIEPADGDWTMHPRKVWHLTDTQVSVDQAIQFFYPPNVTASLAPVLDMARQFSEEESCIPLISAGLTSPQQSDSATGQLIYQQASTTLLDFLGEDWSDYVTGPLVEGYYAWNMQYNPDPAIKGTYTVDVRSGIEYKNKQLYLRDIERLSMEVNQNPALGTIVNVEEMLRARVEMMNLPSKHIIKSPEEAEAAKQEMAQQPNPAMLKLQIEQQTVEQRNRELSLKEAHMAFEMGQQQQREAWDHEEKMTANFARTIEAEARVLTAQTEKETELLKLMQRDKEFAAKMSQEQNMHIQTQQTLAFFRMMEENRKQQETLLKGEEIKAYVKEIDLARDKGEGI